MRRYTDLSGNPFEVRHGEDLRDIGVQHIAWRTTPLVVLDVDPDAHLDGRSGVAIDGATARGLVADLLDALGAKTLDEQLQTMLEAVAPAWAREQHALKAGTVARMFLEMGRVLERARVEADRREGDGLRVVELETALRMLVNEFRDALPYVPDYFRKKYGYDEATDQAAKLVGLPSLAEIVEAMNKTTSPGPDQDIAVTVAEHAAGPMPPAPDELEYERNDP